MKEYIKNTINVPSPENATTEVQINENKSKEVQVIWYNNVVIKKVKSLHLDSGVFVL